MHLPESKTFEYNVDDTKDDHHQTSNKVNEDACFESSYYDSIDDKSAVNEEELLDNDDVENSQELSSPENVSSGLAKYNAGNCCGNGSFQPSSRRKDRGMQNGNFDIAMLVYEPRTTRSRVNYNEDSSSGSSECEINVENRELCSTNLCDGTESSGEEDIGEEFDSCSVEKEGIVFAEATDHSYASQQQSSKDDSCRIYEERPDYSRILFQKQQACSDTKCIIEAISSSYEGIKCLPHVYVRKRRQEKKLYLEKNRKDSSGHQIRVDVYGPFIEGEESRPVVKRVGLIEKILSVRNRGTHSATYCVKLSGKCYRNVVYVSETLLAKDYSQQLRVFLRRMDDLKRFNGNLADKADSPAFDPSYTQVDRVLASEQRGSKRFYLVKWQGLPYSESTWEAEDALICDKDAITRFLNLAAKGAPGSTSSAFKDGRVLRDYQKKGLSWMDHNYENCVNCILADEMGLGKTIQSVAMLQNLRVKWKVKGPFLVVAPVSTLGHWQREIQSLTDMNCLVYSGSVEDRNVMKEYEFYTSSNKLKYNVLLTGFEVLIKDHYFLSKQKWQYIIVDEAHRLKTKQSKTSRTLKEMSVRKGGLLLLTGTPVQNNTRELFGLLNILDPERFKSEDEFMSKYGDIKNVEQVRDLQENILKPRLLRRMKEDVEKSIPLKEETIIWVELTKDQRSYYKAIYENRISDLLRGSVNRNIPNLRNVAMELRKLCNHPFLCDGLELHLASKFKQNGSTKRERSSEILCQSSGKMMLLDKLLPMLKDAGRRVLVFSQFTIMLDLLEDYLQAKKYSYERIDGKIRGSARQAAIDRYSALGSETFIFLLSTRAGGLGITLTAADTCIIYDSDWNPQNDLQAMARCHRIGQTKDVKIYRLITRNTYEQHLFECSSRKYGLDEAILGNMLSQSVDVEHSKNIEALLKRGAYDILKDDGEAESAAFHDQNIDQILEQRTQKRLIAGRGNNTFSVATFISNTDHEADNKETKDPANMESGQFWQELLPEAYEAARSPKKPQTVTSTGPRRRAEVNYKEKGEISDDEGSSNDGESKAEGRKRKHNKNVDLEDGSKQWRERDVKRLENRLLMLGEQRGEQIMVEAKLLHHGLSEVKILINTLIQLYHYFEQKERNYSSEVMSKNKEDNICTKAVSEDKHSTLNLQMPKIPAFAKKAFSSQNYMQRIQKNASRYLQALHERDVLVKTLSNASITTIVFPRSRKLPSWWGQNEDVDLMRGALKHGQKDFDKIREDPDLCFAARFNRQKNNDAHPAEQHIELNEMQIEKHTLQDDEWPNDIILTTRLKKLIECLPNGLSDREIKRRAAIAEAARKRWSAKLAQESPTKVSLACTNGQLELGIQDMVDSSVEWKAETESALFPLNENVHHMSRMQESDLLCFVQDQAVHYGNQGAPSVILDFSSRESTVLPRTNVVYTRNNTAADGHKLQKNVSEGRIFEPFTEMSCGQSVLGEALPDAKGDYREGFCYVKRKPNSPVTSINKRQRQKA